LGTVPKYCKPNKYFTIVITSPAGVTIFLSELFCTRLLRFTRMYESAAFVNDILFNAFILIDLGIGSPHSTEFRLFQQSYEFPHKCQNEIYGVDSMAPSHKI